MNVVTGLDGKPRCAWCSNVTEFLDYHDSEWGRPVSDDRRLFEKLCLESFQSGLSWRTILNKRENFRRAFAGFDFAKVAGYGEDDITRLMNDSGIVRHRGKIEAVVNNARKCVELVRHEGSLAAFIWRFEAETTARPQSSSTSEASHALSRELKKRGWKFVGPTTVFAFMQAMGLVNDHSEGCVSRELVERERSQFRRP